MWVALVSLGDAFGLARLIVPSAVPGGALGYARSP